MDRCRRRVRVRVAGLSLMATYSPTPVPNSIAPRARSWLADELARVATAINANLRLRVLHAEPSRYAEGDIVYADGSDWNPGSGEGVYVRTSSAWAKL